MTRDPFYDPPGHTDNGGCLGAILAFAAIVGLLAGAAFVLALAVELGLDAARAHR